MSYYIGVWEGPAPLSNAHAASEFQRRMAERSQADATPAIRRFVDGVLGVHPDIDRPDGEGGPWSDGPLLRYVDGSTVYLPVRPERVDEVSHLVEQRIEGLELVAFDPQIRSLVPSATEVARTSEFELPTVDELPVHLLAVLSEAFDAGRALAGVLEHVASDYYVQWLVRGGRLTIEAQGEELLDPDRRLGSAAIDHMADLGFTRAEPNWKIRWDDGRAHLDEAATLLGRVLTEVRALPVGEPMRLQTFPV